MQQRKPDHLIIVGGGIVGLATAYRMLQLHPDTRLRIIEKEGQVACHQTGRNSGVIHSGLYYKPGSKKASLCLSGSQQLISFCRTHSIPYEICGKIVVATSASEQQRLEELRQRGLANGLKGLRLIGPEELLEREPNCAGLSALFVPQTGIVNYRHVARQLAYIITSLGGQIQLGECVKSISSTAGDKGSCVRVETNADIYSAQVVVACAGLQSDRLARQQDPELPLRILPFRGEYYQLNPSAQNLVNNLIYPVPDPSFPFLGVHFTRLIEGGIECGPNAVLALAREGYTRTSINFADFMEILLWPGFRPLASRYWREGLNEIWRSWSKPAFVKALQRLVPAIQENDLIPGGAGVRAQACDNTGYLVDDFFIKDQGRVLHICNAPSPAATASLAIGSYLSTLIASRFKD